MKRLLIPFLLLFPATLPAATPGDKEIEQYEVEVLVFENRLPDQYGDELLTREPSPHLLRRLENAAVPETPAVKPYLRPVVTDLIQRDGAYRVLAYRAWQQAPMTAADKDVPSAKIASDQPGELDGAVRLSLNRYLHLDVNMLFRDGTSSDTAAPIFQISEQRRIKSQETQYFDHPRFGVLVRVMPLGKDEKP